jgi:hypothetical protein
LRRRWRPSVAVRRSTKGADIEPHRSPKPGQHAIGAQPGEGEQIDVAPARKLGAGRLPPALATVARLGENVAVLGHWFADPPGDPGTKENLDLDRPQRDQAAGLAHRHHPRRAGRTGRFDPAAAPGKRLKARRLRRARLEGGPFRRQRVDGVKRRCDVDA